MVLRACTGSFGIRRSFVVKDMEGFPVVVARFQQFDAAFGSCKAEEWGGPRLSCVIDKETNGRQNHTADGAPMGPARAHCSSAAESRVSRTMLEGPNLFNKLYLVSCARAL